MCVNGMVLVTKLQPGIEKSIARQTILVECGSENVGIVEVLFLPIQQRSDKKYDNNLTSLHKISVRK